MINLELGLNVVALTLKESTPSGYLTNSYLFKFVSHSTNSPIYFNAQPQNADNSRFNLFTITLVETEAQQNIDLGLIYIPNTGFLEYTIYAQLEPKPFIQTDDVAIEYGRVLYEFSDATITSFSPDIETIIYNG
jgi:hypothetical protein